MSEALARWLALREPADVAARSDALTRRVAGAVASAGTVSVLDLATGSGSNLRFLADRLPGRQAWLLVDQDPVLLSEVGGRTAAWSVSRGYAFGRDSAGAFTVRGTGFECRVEARQMNLGTLEPALFAGRTLVTASALLDLVSEGWLRALAAHCRAAGAAALFAITYDGRSRCEPPDPDDELVRGLMNRHQKGDKGLGGPAAGPDAPSVAERCFRDAGYLVERARTDWVLEAIPGDQAGEDRPQEFQRQLIEGWAEAAVEMAPELADRIARWTRRRLGHVSAGQSRIVVGHEDLAACLPGG